MVFKLTTLCAAILFFVRVNVKKCEEIHADDSTTTAATEKDAISTPSSQEIDTVLSNHNTTEDLNTLSPDKFTKHLSNLLSPKIFSQPNLLQYFLDSTTKLSDKGFGTQLFFVKLFLHDGDFPKPYIPYAKILSSILQCQVQLQNITRKFCKAWVAAESNGLPPPIPDIPQTDETAALRELFSPDIFSDINPLSRLLIKLVELPEKQLAKVAVQLSDLSKDKDFFSQHYWYTKSMSLFIKDHRHQCLGDLKRGLAKLQRRRKLKSSTIGESFPNDQLD